MEVATPRSDSASPHSPICPRLQLTVTSQQRHELDHALSEGQPDCSPAMLAQLGDLVIDGPQTDIATAASSATRPSTPQLPLLAANTSLSCESLNAGQLGRPSALSTVPSKPLAGSLARLAQKRSAVHHKAQEPAAQACMSQPWELRPPQSDLHQRSWSPVSPPQVLLDQPKEQYEHICGTYLCLSAEAWHVVVNVQ